MRIKRDTDKGDTLWHPPSGSMSSSGGAKLKKQVGGRDWARDEPHRAGLFKDAPQRYLPCRVRDVDAS